MRVLESPIVFAPFLPACYQKLSSSPPLVDSIISQGSSLVDLVSLEIQFDESIPNQPLDVEMVDLIPPMVHQVFFVESGSHPPHLLLVSSESSDLEKGPPIPVTQEVSLLAPMYDV